MHGALAASVWDEPVRAPHSAVFACHFMAEPHHSHLSQTVHQPKATKGQRKATRGPEQANERLAIWSLCRMPHPAKRPRRWRCRGVGDAKLRNNTSRSPQFFWVLVPPFINYQLRPFPIHPCRMPASLRVEATRCPSWHILAKLPRRRRLTRVLVLRRRVSGSTRIRRAGSGSSSAALGLVTSRWPER